MKEILNFDKMITPSIIKFVFWIGSAISVFSGFAAIISGASANYGGGAQIFSGLLFIVLGPLAIRIYCELLIIFFKIHESLNTIKNQNRQKAS